MIFRGLDIKQIILSIPVVLMAITFHEYAHGYAAYKMGDPTAKYQGRLSLNPFAHMDIIGAISMLLLGFGWAKPVPVNPNNFRDRKKGTVIVSLAGPMANIALSFVAVIICGLLYRFLPGTLNETMYTFVSYILNILFLIISMNVSFAAFNLIPIPPLDGSKILGVFLPGKYYYKMLQYERYAFPVLILLLYTGIVERILSVITIPIVNSLNFVLSIIGGI